MININKKEECCGCHGCSNICPKQCISMKVDNEGFWYPKIDKNICINCNLCVKVCPIIHKPKREREEIKAYACKNKNEKIRIESSSGGVFSLLCKEIINREGVVFGASYDEKFFVRHTYAENLEECIQFRGSKYVQSKIGNTYKEVKKFLNKGKIVLFSGTPCQISGLDSYLMKKYDNLILVDIACHGVPSPLVYKKYIKELEFKNHSKIKSIKFRDKSTGWKNYSFKVDFEKGTIKEIGYKNIYMQGFLSDIYLRPSCYDCKFKKPVTSADITLADYWGVKQIHNEFDDDKGVSLILVHTYKGEQLLNKISKEMHIIDTNYNHSIKYNQSIVKPIKYNKKRSKFFKNIDKNNIDINIIRYTKIRPYEKIYKKMKKVANKILK